MSKAYTKDRLKRAVSAGNMITVTVRAVLRSMKSGQRVDPVTISDLQDWLASLRHNAERHNEELAVCDVCFREATNQPLETKTRAKPRR